MCLIILHGCLLKNAVDFRAGLHFPWACLVSAASSVSLAMVVLRQKAPSIRPCLILVGAELAPLNFSWRMEPLRLRLWGLSLPASPEGIYYLRGNQPLANHKISTTNLNIHSYYFKVILELP